MAIVAVAALVARAWVASVTPSTPLFLDMAEYWERGVYLWQLGALYPDSWRMPGLPAALAAAFAVTGGPSVEAARWVNVLAGTATAALTYALARRTAAPRAAGAAGLAVALYPALLTYVPLIATETLVTTPLMGALLAATYRSPRGYATAGFLTAIAALVRPPAVVLLPAVMVAALAPTAPTAPLRRRASLAALAVAAFAVTMAPWWLHTAHRHGYVVPFDTTGGSNLLIGNGPGSTGHLESRLFIPISQDPEAGPAASPERDSYYRRMAIDYMLAHPWRTLSLLPAKFSGLFALEGREQAYLYSVGVFGELDAPWLRAWGLAIVMSLPPLLVLAALGASVRNGVVSSVAIPVLALLASATAFHLITLGDPRYHLPLVPVLAVLATGLACPDRRLSRVRLAAALVVLALLIPAWRTQWRTYLDAIEQLAQPGGSTRALDYDALL